MKHKAPLLAVIFVLLYAFYNAVSKQTLPPKTEKSSTYRKHTQIHHTQHAQEELDRLHTTPYAKEYIIYVINHGSRQFHFKGGKMEGGYVSPKDAPKIACYVLSLSGKQCKKPYTPDAEMFYTSVCGGCHGNDGKGLGGIYPDLTRKTLLGIEERETFLKNLLKKE